jgi:hypothetical protein
MKLVAQPHVTTAERLHASCEEGSHT